MFKIGDRVKLIEDDPKEYFLQFFEEEDGDLIVDDVLPKGTRIFLRTEKNKKHLGEFLSAHFEKIKK